MLCCALPCSCVLSQPVANPHSRSVEPNRSMLVQREPGGLFHTNPALVCAPPFFAYFCETELSLQSCALFVDNFPRSRPAPAETETLLRRPQEPHYPKKHRGSRPRVFSPVNLLPNCYSTYPNYLMMIGWHDDVVGMMVWMLTMTIDHCP